MFVQKNANVFFFSFLPSGEYAKFVQNICYIFILLWNENPLMEVSPNLSTQATILGPTLKKKGEKRKKKQKKTLLLHI